MRRLFRPRLEQDLEDYLDRMQKLVDEGAEVAWTWKTQRQSTRMRKIARVLSQITGQRERCMFCEDSRATDVEHFRPQSLYPRFVFRWPNFLWICTACNRSKGNRFPCDTSGQPLLIDPTLDEPWDFLFFDPDTGEITARWEATGTENLRGKTLLETLSPLKHQAVTEGRRRTSIRLRRSVRSFLTQRGPESSEVTDEEYRDLLDCIEDATEYGIAAWFFLRDGRDEEPFQSLRQRFPSAWEKLVSHVGPDTTNRSRP